MDIDPREVIDGPGGARAAQRAVEQQADDAKQHHAAPSVGMPLIKRMLCIKVDVSSLLVPGNETTGMSCIKSSKEGKISGRHGEKRGGSKRNS